METFDALDRRILAQLDSNARQSVSEIARAVRHGRDTVAYRARRLTDSGILRGAEPIIDPASLGFELFKTYLSFAQASHALHRVHERVRNHPHVYCAARAHGRWDLLCNVVAKTPAEYARVRNELLHGYEGHVREIGFAVITQMTYFNRKYLGGARRSWTTLLRRDPIAIDPIDQAVLTQLAVDAARTDAELARALGVSPTVLRYRVEQLEKAGAIVGYRTRFDRAAFQLSSFKLHVSLRDFSEDTLQRIERFAERHPYASQFMLQLGAWPCEVNVEAHDTKHLTETIDELRAALGDRIGLVDVTLYDRDEFTWGFGSKRRQEPPQAGVATGV